MTFAVGRSLWSHLSIHWIWNRFHLKRIKADRRIWFRTKERTGVQRPGRLAYESQMSVRWASNDESAPLQAEHALELFEMFVWSVVCIRACWAAGSVALKSAVSKAFNARMLSNCRRAPGRRTFYDRSSIRNLYAQGSSTTPSMVIETIWQLCKMCTQCVRLYHLNGRLNKLNAVCESKSIHPNFGFQRLRSPGSSRPHNAVFITFKRMKCIPEQNG